MLQGQIQALEWILLLMQIDVILFLFDTYMVVIVTF